MKEMNSDTHSWTHSFASLLTFALLGKEDFMIRATFAIYPDPTGTSYQLGTESVRMDKRWTNGKPSILFTVLVDLSVGKRECRRCGRRERGDGGSTYRGYRREVGLRVGHDV